MKVPNKLKISTQDFSIAGTDQKKVDMAVSTNITKEKHDKFDDFFRRCKTIPCPTQLHCGCTPKVIQRRIREPTGEANNCANIIIPPGFQETHELGNNFVLVPKPNSIVHLCLYPESLNKAIIRPIHRGPTVNDIFQKLTHAQYLSLIDSSSG